jgi:hypothetical protein
LINGSFSHPENDSWEKNKRCKFSTTSPENKREGILWVKTERARKFRTEMKGFVARVERHFQDEGCLLYNFPTVH